MIRLSTGLRTLWLGTAASAKAVQELLSGGMIRIYSGAQPANADAVETGTLLCDITLASGAFTPGANGASTNGLTFADAVAAAIGKTVAEVWSGEGLAANTAGWFRFYASERVTGASTSSVRFDGDVSSVAAGTGDLQIDSTSIATGAVVTVTQFDINLPFE
jgi:hypothetical protein